MSASQTNQPVSSRRFLLEAVDEATECVTKQVDFEVEDINELCTLVDAEVENISRFTYELEPDQLERVKQQFKVEFDSGGDLVRLSPWLPIHPCLAIYGTYGS